MLGNLRGALAGTTVLMVASRPSTIALADDVVYLERRPGRRPRHARRADGAPAGYRRLVEAFETDRRRARRPRRGRRHVVDAGDRAERTSHVGRLSARAHDRPRASRRRRCCARACGVTWLLAAVGAGGRVVVPILLQQAIDRGIVGRATSVRVGLVAVLAAIAAVALVIVGHRPAPGGRAPRARAASRRCTTCAARLIAHIHRLSLADHNEERRGALVARVTSDIETLAQFFQWGGLAWLLDGPLMLIVGAVMLAYDWILALVAFAVAAPLALVLRAVQRHLVAGLRAASASATAR